MARYDVPSAATLSFKVSEAALLASSVSSPFESGDSHSP
jgi:hypothetical protein